MSPAIRVPVQRSACDFEMQKGVVRVWTDATRTTEIGGLPGSDYDFFSDMQRRALNPDR